MQYIRESWYPASWSSDLLREPLGRTFLEEEVLLYRREDGAPVALSNVCPHRFAALSKGRLHGDAIACPYHGLQFGTDGQCRHNPHGVALAATRVRVYPVSERYGMVWIWMGEPANADAALLPPLPPRDDESLDWLSGSLHVQGNYQLVIDNLLDLTHVEFMHPFLANLDEAAHPVPQCFKEGDAIVSRYVIEDGSRSQLVASLWVDAPERTSMVTEMRWRAPANLLQSNSFDRAGKTDAPHGRLKVPFCHLLTPETATTTHYFWAAGRNLRRNEPELDSAMRTGIESTFKGEDEPMIADIQRRMGDRELMEMRPLLLTIDKSAVLARRAVATRLADEGGDNLPGDQGRIAGTVEMVAVADDT